uniref:Uncharacterized protein n=1 Tax=Stomoxys calcitrans TaxID=35570 RepID=A0A1I8P9B2_STOCA
MEGNIDDVMEPSQKEPASFNIKRYPKNQIIFNDLKLKAEMETNDVHENIETISEELEKYSACIERYEFWNSIKEQTEDFLALHPHTIEQLQTSPGMEQPNPHNKKPQNNFAQKNLAITGTQRNFPLETSKEDLQRLPALSPAVDPSEELYSINFIERFRMQWKRDLCLKDMWTENDNKQTLEITHIGEEKKSIEKPVMKLQKSPMLHYSISPSEAYTPIDFIQRFRKQRKEEFCLADVWASGNSKQCCQLSRIGGEKQNISNSNTFRNQITSPCYQELPYEKICNNDVVLDSKDIPNEEFKPNSSSIKPLMAKRFVCFIPNEPEVAKADNIRIRILSEFVANLQEEPINHYNWNRDLSKSCDSGLESI